MVMRRRFVGAHLWYEDDVVVVVTKTKKVL